MICAAAITGAAFTGLAAGTASADAGCPDLHWIGAAGSGERANPTENDGMGQVVFDTFRQLQATLAHDGRTITAEAVDYPATAVPPDGSIMGWAGFMNSVDAGTAALGKQYAAYTQQCPNTKVVLAGYSQGAMVVHRNLYGLAGSPNLAATLLIADGDRIPDDTTVDLGTVTAVPGRGLGAAQDHYILAHTNTAKLPAALGSRTISVCDLNDPVCDYNSDANSTASAAVSIHTGYSVASSEGRAWTSLLEQLLSPSGAPSSPASGVSRAAA
ncbi:MAG TPA: cutinase family protein [Mycobacterium sp.]|nr:cutinase family protein [Mycobacterium sp.]